MGNGKKIQLLVFIFLLNVIKRGPFKSIVRSKILRIYKKKGLLLSIKKIEWNIHFQISLFEVYIKIPKYQNLYFKKILFIPDYNILKLFFKKCPKIKYLIVEEIKVWHYSTKIYKENISVNSIPQNWFSSNIFNSFSNKKFNYVYFLINKVEVDNLCLSTIIKNVKVNLNFNKLVKNNQTISFNFLGSVKNFSLNAHLKLNYLQLEKKVDFITVSNFRIKQLEKEILYFNNFFSNNKFTEKGAFSIDGKLFNLYIDFPLLSQEKIHFKLLEWNLKGIVLKKNLKINADSRISLDNIPFLIELDGDMINSTLFKVSIIFILHGETFFNNFPKFQIRELKKIRAKGNLAFQLIYVHDLLKKKNSFIRMKTIKNDVVIEELEVSNFLYLSKDFEHKVMKNGVFLKNIQISERSKKFIKLKDIPITLQKLVVLTEDPNFYEHNGIDLYSLGYAILENIKSGKFLRGGSTITMQLVRNLYLGHEKNIMRKLEEIIVSWIAENYINLKKDRILELYFNIIEFGKNLYGIKEAALFYFNKSISETSFIEQLVLSYIIPRPDFFMDALLHNSKQLKLRLKAHIDRYSQQFYDLGIISKEDIIALPNKITFKPELGTFYLD